VVGFRKNQPPFPEAIEEIPRFIKKIRKHRSLRGRLLKFLWDFVEYNPVAISKSFRPKKSSGRLGRGISIMGPEKNLIVKRGAVVYDYSVIDVRNGPVIIDEEAEIRPFSFIEGPCYIGKRTIVDGAKVRGGCSFGPECRIGGEIEATIFQGYSNKHHEGFLGHSFIGEWVNLGAGTTNSDLKNNYSEIRVIVNRRAVNTGLIKVGCFIGDHTKTGIGTLIPTGGVMGIFVNFYGGGMAPSCVPSFKWGTSSRLVEYRIDEAIKTARTVMKRRGVVLSKKTEKFIRKLYGRIDRY
ncbi:MAG: hypothetical protein ABIL05_03260, partial [candidate division WOR-3 bacterium]